ncbi:hypothetical protein [Salibacterium aidingense]|uniref:hypothetical protein n=1 Tax=Salibacterium aidingense TaxID=384933 RepID=UPI003BD2604D
MKTTSDGKVAGKITDHAVEQAEARFGVPRSEARSWIRERFARSKYITEIASEEGKPAKLFTYHRICFVVDPATNAIITVYHPRIYRPLHDKYEQMARRDLRKAETEAAKVNRKVAVQKAELEVERAETKLLHVRARSQAKKRAYQARINAIDARLAELDEESAQAERTRVQVAKGVAAYV